jgi:hypothetical protein
MEKVDDLIKENEEDLKEDVKEEVKDNVKKIPRKVPDKSMLPIKKEGSIFVPKSKSHLNNRLLEFFK